VRRACIRRPRIGGSVRGYCRFRRCGCISGHAGARGTPAEPAAAAYGLCARVSSHDQKPDLDRQVARLTAWAAEAGGRVVRVEAEVGSGMNGSRAKVRRLLADPKVTTVVVEHRDRLGRMNTELVESALSAHGRRLLVLDDGEVTTARLAAWEHEPPVWLRKAQARKRRSARKVGGRPGAQWIGVSCCACGTVRQVRPSLVKGYTHLVCGPCGKVGKRPEVPSRPGVVLVHTFDVAGFFDGCTYRIAAAEERASIARAAALAWAAFLNAPGEAGRGG
jgi:Resolvase, N terminal domain